YQAEGTRGRVIQERKETVKIHGKQIPINAQIEMIDGFSGHADYNEMLAWLMPFNKAPKQIFMVHGESEASQSMAEKINKTYGWNVTVPQFGDSFELE
ncbi:MAG TPA: MBL fold metallo-hydrolase, partial [Bacteroidetes bacterium]|nr:MBL fold metallo-hydrolase [Bacteroidota bacterium]